MFVGLNIKQYLKQCDGHYYFVQTSLYGIVKLTLYLHNKTELSFNYSIWKKSDSNMCFNFLGDLIAIRLR